MPVLLLFFAFHSSTAKHLELLLCCLGVQCVLQMIKSRRHYHMSHMQVESLADIAAATSGEVTIQHLGTRFAAAAGDYFLQGAAAQASAVNAYDMPQF